MRDCTQENDMNMGTRVKIVHVCHWEKDRCKIAWNCLSQSLSHFNFISIFYKTYLLKIVILSDIQIYLNSWYFYLLNLTTLYNTEIYLIFQIVFPPLPPMLEYILHSTRNLISLISPLYPQ